MITVEHAICTGCGQCIAVCPFTVLERNADEQVICNDKSCIACMHCAAICPQGAITFDGASAVSGVVTPLPKNTATVVQQLITQRRSYRKFQNRPVSPELIQQALQAAMLAPSAKNEHPTKWIILQDAEKQQEIMQAILQFCAKTGCSPEIPLEYARKNNPVIGEHAVLLIGYCKKTALNPSQDTAIALATAELMLQANGIGTCWGGYLTRFLNQIPACRTCLQLPEDCNVYGTLMLGYPAQNPYRAVPKRLQPLEMQWI